MDKNGFETSVYYSGCHASEGAFNRNDNKKKFCISCCS